MAVKERIEFSIGLKLSLRYIKILLFAMLIAGAGIIMAFGGLTIWEKVSQNLMDIAEIADDNTIPHEKIKAYSLQHHTPVLIYNNEKELVYATEPDLAEHGYKRSVGIVLTDDHIYLAVNRDRMTKSEPLQFVIYSDIQEELVLVLKLAKITLYVFAAVLLFCILAIAFVGRGIFQPIREMTYTVKDISEKNLNLRLNVSGSKNELKELALTFNEMMNRIEEHSNRQKQFVSDASHELRTPIAVIQGYAVMLDRWGKNDQAVLQESVDAIKNEAENMRELIDKLLFLARHDNSTFVFQKEEFSLTEMLQEIVKETQMIDSSHRINCEINKEVSLCADKSRLKQAFRIFIDNAIKYTPQNGEITISLKDEEHSIVVRIKDTGAGMTKEELQRIFDRFYRAEQSRTREKGGHGLGLAIAKIIILGHNGKITVRSKVGEGSEFMVILAKDHRV